MNPMINNGYFPGNMTNNFPNNPYNNPMGNNFGMNAMNVNPSTFTRISKEFQLCSQDNDLIQIGCTFGLENNNIMTWRVTMVGPVNTPYNGGLFTLLIIFPSDYPNHGPEFRFRNKMYHLNVVSNENSNDFGHICVNSINEWRTTGRVKGGFYTIKQALFDIFCLFYNQGVISAYDKKMADDYQNNPQQFEEQARKWTQMYAAPQ